MERSTAEGGDVTKRILELQADNLAFSTEIRSLQKRLVEVRARRHPTPPKACSSSSSPRPGVETHTNRQIPNEVARSQLPDMLYTARDAMASMPRAQETPIPSNQGAQTVAASFSGSRDSVGFQAGAHSTISPSVVAPCVSAARTAVYLAQLPSVPPLPDNGASGPGESQHVPAESMLPTQGEQCIDQLKNENNRLTEQLVEASLESAQNFESFSNDRNALWNFAQELRTRVQNEQSERQRCAALLESTQEALERLAAENLQMAEDLMRARSGERSATTTAATTPSVGLPDKTIDALWTVHRREVGRLRQEVQERLQECDQMRRFVSQQASQANATILEMARRNLELEDRLRETCKSLEDHGISIPSGVSSALSGPKSPPGAELVASMEALKTEKQDVLLSRSPLAMTEGGSASSRERRSSSVPPQFLAQAKSIAGVAQVMTNPSRSNGAQNVPVEVEDERSGTRTLRTATLAATTATEAANTATRAANAAAAAAEAAAKSESFARAEWRARLVGAGLEGFLQDPLKSSDSIGNLAPPSTSNTDQSTKVSTRGLETPPNGVGRQAVGAKVDSPSGRGPTRRNSDARQQSHQTSEEGFPKSLSDSFSSLGKLAEAREARRRHVTTAMQPLPGESSWLPAVSSGQEEFTLNAPMSTGAPLASPTSELATSMEMQTERRGGSPRSPFMGGDYRYTGRGVGPQHTSHRSTSSVGSSGTRRNDRLQRDLDTMSAEMRRVQHRALLAAQ